MTSSATHVFTFFNRRRLPVILQAGAAECALACLAMVSAYWGRKEDLPALRRRFGTSLRGMTLRSLLAAAHEIDLQPRALKLGLQRVRELRLPAILHWDMNHFVVLKELRGSRWFIHDPASGPKELSAETVSRHFTGVAVEFLPLKTDESEKAKAFGIVRFALRVRGLRSALAQIAALAICLQACMLLGPFYLQWVVDEAVVASDRGLLTVLGIGFLLLVSLQSALEAVRSWITARLATEMNFQWCGAVFKHLMKLPMSFFEQRHIGDIVSRFTSIHALQKAVTSQFVEGVVDLLIAFGTFSVMMFYSAQLTMIACASAAGYGMIRWAMFRPMRQASAEQIAHAASQQTHFLESARGIQATRLFGHDANRQREWLDLLARQFNAELSLGKLSISHHAVETLLTGSERIIIVWLAALAVMDARFSIGMLFAFVSYKDQFSQRVSALIDKAVELQMVKLHGERLSDILLTRPECDDEHHSAAHDFKASIELRNVSFRYGSGEPLVLRDVNLVIPAGQCVAVTGPSGCGKTTLVKLLLGLLQPTSGEVLLDGISLKQIGAHNFRKLVGSVMQEDYLFSGSFEDNISFFDPAPDRARIENCARLAGVHEEIVATPMGYRTLVAHCGSSLSGGQRQRVFLARALYKSPRVLVLDEATSHLDSVNERLVNAAIGQSRLTRIVIAHRSETIAMAQRVVVLENGEIISDLSPVNWRSQTA